MKIFIAIALLLALGIGYYLIEPALSDDIVEEELAITIPTTVNDSQDQPAIVETTNDKITDSATTEPVETTEPLTSADNSQQIEQISERVRQGDLTRGKSSYRAQGTVYVSGQNLSLVDLDSTNVPDGFVYLSNDLEADDSVRIAALKGNKGNHNYLIPDEIDADDYQYVLLWCRAFSSLVGYAELD